METPVSFIHHLGVFASDFEASERFYTAALAPLGIAAGYRSDGVAEFWHPDRDTPSVSLSARIRRLRRPRGCTWRSWPATGRRWMPSIPPRWRPGAYPGTLRGFGVSIAPTARSSAIPMATTSRPCTRKSSNSSALVRPPWRRGAGPSGSFSPRARSRRWALTVLALRPSTRRQPDPGDVANEADRRDRGAHPRPPAVLAAQHGHPGGHPTAATSADAEGRLSPASSVSTPAVSHRRASRAYSAQAANAVKASRCTRSPG
jgi:catechol 2,3-dioxygenase-like lactoylglutathione lyase family enzyme